MAQTLMLLKNRVDMLMTKTLIVSKNLKCLEILLLPLDLKNLL
jgi:hypothetical protein